MIKNIISINNFGRCFLIPTNPILKAEIETWKDFKRLFSTFEYIEESKKATITFEWHELAEYVTKSHQEDLELNEILKEGNSKKYDNYSENRKLSPIVNSDFDIPTSSNNSYNNLDLTNRSLYEIFLTMNISAPGSFCFFKIRNNKDSLKKLNLNCYYFESSWLESISYGWPKIEHIDLEKCINWVRSQNINTKDYAKTKIQRSIYSLLHACTLEHGDITIIIWLTYALESLYETPNGQAFSVLFKRIVDILKVPEEKKKQVKKKLRDFYNHRHKLVHGHSPLVHPLKDYEEDSEADKEIFEILYLCEFIFTIILATIQTLITNSWSSITFYEKWEGVPIEE